MPQIDRRTLLKTAVAFTAATETTSAAIPARLTQPRALKPGDSVGLITPSGYVSDPSELAFAQRFGYLAGIA